MQSKTTFFLIFAAIIFVSCGHDPQYSVHVSNDTSGPITVSYSSQVDVNGPVTSTVVIPRHEKHMIICTNDITPEEGPNEVSPEHCALVAEAVTAVNSDGVPSTIAWCTDGVKFIHTDVGQGEFWIDYTDKDF